MAMRGGLRSTGIARVASTALHSKARAWGRSRIAWTPADLRAPVRPSKIVCVGRELRRSREKSSATRSRRSRSSSSSRRRRSSVRARPSCCRRRADARSSTRPSSASSSAGASGRVAREQAMAAVYGYTCVCDVTARDLQKKDGQWTRAKGFDTFCPTGPWIETELDSVAISTREVPRRRRRPPGTVATSQMIFDIALAPPRYVSTVMTLEPGRPRSRPARRRASVRSRARQSARRLHRGHRRARDRRRVGAA